MFALVLPSTTAPERLLLGLAGAFVSINSLALALLRNDLGRALIFTLIWWTCALLGHHLLNRHLPHRDNLLFPIALFLTGMGIIMIDRLAPNFGERQIIWLPIATLALLGSACGAWLLHWLARYRYLLLFFGLALLISTILLGENPSRMAGAPELWLGFGQVFFQPSEALKIILVAFLANYLTEHAQVWRISALGAQRIWFLPRLVGPVLLMWTVSVVVLVWQRDLGTASLFFLVFLVLVYLATGRRRILVLGLALTLAAAWVAYHIFAVVRLRIDIWLNPWLEPDGRAYQIVQSLMAFAAGGIAGTGIGQGSPTFIPVVHSDFIFAAIAEEWGLLAIITLIACFMLFSVRGMHIAIIYHEERPFYALIASGLTALITLQALLIMGGVLKLLPLTGVTLPFVSYGGSSLLMSFIIVGLLLRLSSKVN